MRGPSRSGHLLERDDGRPFDRRTIHRYVDSVAKRAGVGHVHPHQLRHTLATQSINGGMSLEAIAALARAPLHGHDADLCPHLRRHRRRRVLQGDRSGRSPVLRTLRRRPSSSGSGSSTPSANDHRRLLANGHCTRPALLDCPSRAFVSAVGSSRPVRSSSPS